MSWGEVVGSGSAASEVSPADEPWDGLTWSSFSAPRGSHQISGAVKGTQERDRDVPMSCCSGVLWGPSLLASKKEQRVSVELLL